MQFLKTEMEIIVLEQDETLDRVPLRAAQDATLIVRRVPGLRFFDKPVIEIVKSRYF